MLLSFKSLFIVHLDMSLLILSFVENVHYDTEKAITKQHRQVLGTAMGSSDFLLTSVAKSTLTTRSMNA